MIVTMKWNSFINCLWKGWNGTTTDSSAVARYVGTVKKIKERNVAVFLLIADMDI